MSLAHKQITFHKPSQIGTALNEGIRALAEHYAGNMQQAADHCLDRVPELTQARLDRMRGTTPGYTRDGQSFITLIWVLLVDGLIPHRQSSAVREWFATIINATDLIEGDLTSDNLPDVMTIFVETVQLNDGYPTPTLELITPTLMQVWAATPPLGDGTTRSLPIPVRLFVGRDDDTAVLYRRLGVGAANRPQRRPLTIVRGWPGVGKTALINVLAHDKQVSQAFADGVLWASLGEDGDIFGTLRAWAKQLGALHLLAIQQLPELLDGLRMVLSKRDLLVVVDDIWTEEQGQYVRRVVDLSTNTLLLTTRFTEVAKQLADLPEDIYVLESLSEGHSIELLTILAPDPVRIYQKRIPQLVRVLEGLPLALRVAGPTLQYYHTMHFDIVGLLDEFEQDYNRLLGSIAPNDRFDEKTGKTPTIELLFKRSVDTLTPAARRAFAGLGVFKQKPATFNDKALKEVWEVANPNPLIETLIGRGLMDTAPDRRYRIHQTLHMYANKLLDELVD